MISVMSGRTMPSRAGIQLLELVIALATSSILIAGISSSLFLAAQTRDRSQSLRDSGQALQGGLDRLRQDLAEAKAFANISSDAITLTVADRDGDSLDETYQYEWPGAGQGLRYHNGSDWATITGNLTNFSIQPRFTPPAAIAAVASLDPPDQFTFVARTHASAGTPLNSDSGTDLSVNLPATFATGDLLLAAIAIDGNQSNSILADASWTKILEVNSADDISLAVFYTSNPSSNVIHFTWPNVAHSHATVAHFRPPSATFSFASFATDEGNSRNPLCPKVATAAVNPLVLRILGTDQTYAPNESTNMPGHFPIVFRSRAFTGPSIAMAFANFASVNPVPSANFGLAWGSPDYVTATVVFLP
jgi:type II secretory pathway pseudopilin PulG